MARQGQVSQSRMHLSVCAGRSVHYSSMHVSDFVQAEQITGAKQTLERLRANMRHTIKGKDDVIEQVLVGVVAGGHLLIEDLPGVGKTTLAYSLARSMLRILPHPVHQ